jgi:hypothetical protein
MSVRTLKDGWSGAGAAIDELEKEGMVLVTRTNKDNLPKFVFWNDIQEHEGGKRVEQGSFVLSSLNARALSLFGPQSSLIYGTISKSHLKPISCANSHKKVFKLPNLSQ